VHWLARFISWLRLGGRLGQPTGSGWGVDRGPLGGPVKPGEDPNRSPQAPRIGNLDDPRYCRLPESRREREVLERITDRIDSGRFSLPQLPTTGAALINVANKPGVDVREIVELVSSDPSLAGELLRMANSALYATHVPAETIDQALMRIGLRELRSLVFSVSVRGSVLDLERLEVYSQEVWRQAFSVGSIAQWIAPLIGETRDRAFLIGLLHDVGKIALLSMLSDESDRCDVANPALIGRVFHLHHERVGALLASKWRLSEELASVAGCHHRFLQNTEYGHSAALASLAHKIDLHLSHGDEVGFSRLFHTEEFDYLGIPEERRHIVLREARRCCEELTAPAVA
jgi:HD-like signal output (HDOD) protein